MTATPPSEAADHGGAARPAAAIPAPVDDESDAALWHAWFAAAATPQTDAALRDLYDRLDAQVAARGPTCWASGRCCNFDAYGHRLYVTGLEIAWVVGKAQGVEFRVQSSGKTEDGIGVHPPHRGAALPLFNSEPRTLNPEQSSCPFQVDRLCSVHGVRPLGCRVFFCQRGTEAWQQDLYEKFLGELRGLHAATSLPYRYMEWRQGLRQAAEFR